MAIGDPTKQTVRERANYLCEYCHSPERLSANRFTIEHIIPRSLGGSDDLQNLALACRRCNERRYNFVAGVDPVTQEIVPLFNPRSEKWEEHFVWLEGGVIIQGVTAKGRATCDRHKPAVQTLQQVGAELVEGDLNARCLMHEANLYQ